MRSEDSYQGRRAARAGDLRHEQELAKDSSAMTTRGTKYWSSGAIPLIAPEILGDIISEVADLAIVISEECTILSVLVNPENDGFRRLERHEGRMLQSVLTEESVPKLENRLARFLGGDERPLPIELNHRDEGGKWEFPLRYTMHRIGPDGTILMLGRDLRMVAEMQQQLVKAQIALERDYEVQREYDTRFRVLMESATEPFAFVSVQSGIITDLNSAAARMFGRAADDLRNRALTDEIECKDGPDLIDTLQTQAIAERSVPTKATLRRDGDTVSITGTLFRAAGDRILLCRFGQAETAAQTGSELSSNLLELYANGPDGIVFTDESGAILSSNEGFLVLIDAAHDLKVKGRRLSDFLVRGSVDFRVLADNAARSGRMRLYPTKIAGEFGSPRPVEIAVTALSSGKSTVYAFVFRDTSRIEAVRPATSTPVTDDNVRSVMELVGNATLKEIVAETTNVVERMCIETAVELTMNNRVAAAEMLGLSRQSLYVKLRKYGLLARGGDDD